MEKSLNSLYYSSLLSESPSVRDRTSRHFNRFQNSLEASSMHLLPHNLIDQSVFLNPQNESTLMVNNQSFDDNNVYESTLFLNETNISLSREEDREQIEPCLTLFDQFFDVNQKMMTEDVLEVMREYELLCSDHLAVTSALIKSKVRHLSESKAMNKMQDILRLERNTWRLAQTLLTAVNRSDVDEEMAVEDMITRMSDKKLVENTFERVSSVRRMQLVVDWLERNQLDDNLEFGNSFDKIEFYSQGPHCWENSLHFLKTKSDNYLTKDRDFCPEMDPDGPIRTKKSLHDLDREDENRLFRYIFHLLRAGQLFAAKEVAQRLGYHWLSAALEGWFLHNDPNYLNDFVSNPSVEPIEGNANRDLWKSVCWKSCSLETNLYEKAIFAILSANINALLPFCTRWSDKVWAYFKASLDVTVEALLRDTIVSNHESKPRYTVDLPDSYWDNKLTAGQAFREIESQGSVSANVEEGYHQTIQKLIILEDFGSLVDHLYEWCQRISQMRQKKKEEVSVEDRESSVDSHLLRFFAHLVLCLRALDLSENRQQLCDSVLEKYIDFLIERKSIDLITFYTTKLPKNNQILTFAKLLEQIEDQNDRKLCIVLAKNANLDISSITATVVDNMRTRTDGQFAAQSAELTNFTNIEDKRKINALDWLLLTEVQQFGEALKQANALMRTFLLLRKVDAGKEAFLKLPEDIIDCVFRQWRRRTGKDELPAEEDNAIREYLCHKAYFQANDAFTEWLHCLHNSKPKQPEKPKNQRFMDKVSFEHSLKDYEMEKNHWKEMLTHQGIVATEKIENVLLFPDSDGWMSDMRESDDSVRRHELEELRKQYIPQMVFICHSIHFSSNNLRQCLKLADIIVDERKKIYKTFSNNLLIDLLNKLRENSIQLLNESSDPLGYQ